MNHVAARLALATLVLGAGSLAHGQPGSPAPGATAQETTVSTRASGTFEVKLTPQAKKGDAADAALGRMVIHKSFHGDLEALGEGQMLTAMTDVQGSAGYVAIELVSGTLGGRSGTFVLQHSGTMTRGTPQLSVTVVPDSATGQLVGLVGTMSIKIESGQHHYEFEYTLPEAR